MFKWLKLDIALEGWTWCPLSAWLMQRWDEAWVDIIQYKRSSAAAGNIHAALVSVHWWPQITSAAQRLDPQLPFAVVHIIFIVSYYNTRINNLLSPSSICISISLNANTGPALFLFFLLRGIQVILWLVALGEHRDIRIRVCATHATAEFMQTNRCRTLTHFWGLCEAEANWQTVLFQFTCRKSSVTLQKF